MLPIALHPRAGHAVIVGGGSVARRKAESFLRAGFALVVVAPTVDAHLRELLDGANAVLHERAYAESDVDGASVVVAATDDPTTNARVVADARAARVLVCDASTPQAGDFTMLATHRSERLTFAVDSGESTPAFSKRLVDEIAAHFDARYDAAAQTLAGMRAYVRAVLPQAERSEVLHALAALPIDDLATMNPARAEHEVEAAIVRVRAEPPAAQMPHVVCASRASALAMTQTRMIAARLAERGIATTILPITTTGDRIQDRSLAQLGSVNVFVKELEVALRERRADYAVHSCKDLPGALEPDMRIAAISTREDPRDAFCSERYENFEALPSGAVVGTSSPRRRTQLAALRADLRYEDVRGNIDTRLRKLREGSCDAIVLAMAGLERLRVRATYTVPFSVDTIVPAVAQGALAIETRDDDDALAQRLRDAVNDPRAELAVVCERAALRALRAGCSAPLGIHARFENAELIVDAAYAPPDGSGIVRTRTHATVQTLEDAERLGESLAHTLSASIDRSASHPTR